MDEDTNLFNVEPVPAPDFAGITAWISSGPLSLKDLRGKVVLVDFWTYSCVNCVRTLPYIEQWYKTYKDKGLVIVGVHAPEFEFEKNEDNVRKAVTDRHLTYPVAMDNNYVTWNAFNNHYWPAHYLIDKQGNVRRVHFGEGQYAEGERAIQKLLGEDGPLTAGADPDVTRADMTPETYFGADRAENFSGDEGLGYGPKDFKAVQRLLPSHWTLAGKWEISGEKATSKADDAKLTFRVSAKDVYVVVSQDEPKDRVITIAAEAPASEWNGPDAPDGRLRVGMSTIYHIVSFTEFQDATLTLAVPAGISLHSFTFGG